eukprot:2130646-Pyramimonas_sp.AAC.1
MCVRGHGIPYGQHFQIRGTSGSDGHRCSSGPARIAPLALLTDLGALRPPPAGLRILSGVPSGISSTVLAEPLQSTLSLASALAGGPPGVGRPLDAS